MRKGYFLTERQAAAIFIILSAARLKLKGKVQTSAEKQYRKFEEALILI